MRPLIINQALRDQVQAVLDHAETHPWQYEDPTWNPGEDPRHIVETQFGYRAIYSITVVPDYPPLRHLSISVPGTGFPHGHAVWVLGRLFGFTGGDESSMLPDQSWNANLDLKQRCIVVAQPIEPEDRGVLVS